MRGRAGAALTAALGGVRFELLFVDDGSRDRTAVRVTTLRAADPRVKAIGFTRRF